MALIPNPEQEHAFAEQYGNMGEAELLSLAASYDTLIEPAQSALRAEFKQRKMEPPLIEEDVVTDDSPENRLVTVRRYRDLSEAIVARSVLESAGLFCVLRDENMVRLEWQISNGIGGLRLQVRAADEAEATELLNQPMPQSIAMEGEADYNQPVCPRCGSTDVGFEDSGRKAAVASLFVLGLPMPLGVESCRCHVCGARWTDDGEERSVDPDMPVEKAEM
jgi:Putative prokaryotic signal transducing protein